MNNKIPNFRENYYFTKQKKTDPFIITPLVLDIISTYYGVFKKKFSGH